VANANQVTLESPTVKQQLYVCRLCFKKEGHQTHGGDSVKWYKSQIPLR